MSKIVKNASARQLANVAERSVISLTQGALNYLLCCSLPRLMEGGQTPSNLGGPPEHYAAAREAHTLLEDSFKPEFYALFGGTVSEPFEAALNALIAELKSLDHDMEKASTEFNARTVYQLAERISGQTADRISEFLGQLFDSVVAHERSSAKLAKDTDAEALERIDNLTRQISFIAINASVEAARVGDAGRGFAIIAKEIKSLSEQSNGAVERIRSALT